MGWPSLAPILLLAISNVFMTFAWYGHLKFTDRPLWLVVVAMWALMLLWSKLWLDRFQYGPFEWLWRSLARWSPQPMRKRPSTA